MKGSIQYGTTEIDYNLTYSDRKTLGISVYPDRTVWVTAPVDAEIEKIEKKIRKRASWIQKQKRRFSRFERKLKHFDYVSGETHLYLGRQYRLKVNQIKNNLPETVKMKGRYICINTHIKKDAGRCKKLLDTWYREHARNKFAERFDYCSSYINKYDIKPSGFRMYSMEKRWGSFSAGGDILLNPELIKHPLYCIDYVIIHEMCHIKYPNHSSDFYRLLNRVLPDWQKRKDKLERYKN